MTRPSTAVPALPDRSDEPVEDDEEEEEGAEEGDDEEGDDVAGQGAGSDPDSDSGGGEEEAEEVVIEGVEEGVEEEVEEYEEEEEEGDEEEEEEEEQEEADGDEEEVEEGQEVEEAVDEEEKGEGDREAGEKEENQGGGSDGATAGAIESSQQIKSEGEVEGLKLIHSSANKSETSSMSNSLVGEALFRKETSAEDLEPDKKDHETLGDCQLPSTGDSITTDKQEPLYLKEKELVVGVIRKRCRNGDLDGIMHPEKEASNFDRREYSMAANLEPTSSRPRSPMADLLENSNKKPAVVCDFFASGWCIKGNSCRFLHQKDGADASQESKENLVGAGRQRDSKEDTGLKHEVDRLYTSRESLVSTADSASESLQRALVRAYGSHGLQTDSSLGTNAQNVSVQLATANSDLFPDRHKTNYGEIDKIPSSGWPSYRSEKLDSHFNSIDGGLSVTGDFISRKYLGEGKLYHGSSKLEHTHNESFSRGSPVVSNSFIPESKYCSSSSLTYSRMYQRTNTPHANDRSSADPIARYQGLPSLHGSTSYHTEGLLNSSFHGGPLSQVLHSSNSFSPNAFHHNHGSIPLGTEDVGNYKRLDYERRYDGSRSSSPFSEFGPENIHRLGIVESTSVSAANKVQSSRDVWEPSVPFRSSFYCPPVIVSSPGSQYDPLSDSIEPPKATPPSLSNQHKSVDHVLRGSHSPGYIDSNLPISFRNSGESLLSKSNSEYGTGLYPPLNAAVPGSGALDGANRSSMLKEKSWSPGHVIDVGNMKEMDYENHLRNQEDKGRHSREPKALKNFRASLVEFVKDLVKPAWREGHLSKDAHKMVVKKAAEKVLSALQPHQIPTGVDAINQYLSASRPKIVKLVEGYVDKYSKS